MKITSHLITDIYNLSYNYKLKLYLKLYYNLVLTGKHICLPLNVPQFIE